MLNHPRVNGGKLQALLTRFKSHIGSSLVLDNQSYTLIEVLDHPPSIILKLDLNKPTIQADAYGNARRQVEDIVTIKVLDGAGDNFTEQFLGLLHLLNDRWQLSL